MSEFEELEVGPWGDGSMTGLSPYDTGERLEPRPWVMQGTVARAYMDPDDFGKVDFDDDEGATIATVWFEKQKDGGYVMHIRSSDAMSADWQVE